MTYPFPGVHVTQLRRCYRGRRSKSVGSLRVRGPMVHSLATGRSPIETWSRWWDRLAPTQTPASERNYTPQRWLCPSRTALRWVHRSGVPTLHSSGHDPNAFSCLS